MFAADAHFELRTNLAATFDADFDQFADALLIDRDERVGAQNTARGVDTEEASGVVA